MDIVAVKDSELERYVTKIMLEIGVPAHLKGYHYLRDAIILSGKDMEVVSSVTKLLYPTIAKHFKTTDQKVERAIRNAIEVSWSRGNVETFEKIFGYSVAPEGQDLRTASTSHVSPTTSDWIIRLCNILILIIWNRESLLIKQMQYSPLQTEKDRVSEWGSFRYAVFCCMEMLLYLSSPYKYGKMYKSPCKKKAGMGDENDFSDIGYF